MSPQAAFASPIFWFYTLTAAATWMRSACSPPCHWARFILRIGQPRLYAHLPPGKESAIRIAQELQDAVLALRSGATIGSAATAEEG